MSDDLSTWKTKAEAATFVGVSEKAVERAADRDLNPIRSAWRRDVGKKPYRVFHPEDLQRWRNSIPRQVQGEVVTTSKAGGLVAEAMGRAGSGSKVVVQLLPAERKLVLSPPEACAYSGLSRALLERAIKSGHLPAFPDGRWKWKVLRSDLRAFVGQITAGRQGVRAAGQ